MSRSNSQHGYLYRVRSAVEDGLCEKARRLRDFSHDFGDSSAISRAPVLMRVRKLLADDVSLIATIDRSEHVDVQYGVIAGRLTEQPVAMTEIPTWDPTGSGP